MIERRSSSSYDYKRTGTEDVQDRGELLSATIKRHAVIVLNSVHTEKKSHYSHHHRKKNLIR